ncbi:hypothetical protein ENUP19_0039G0011 [Entamoeba nuttalli]|uniref:TLDc domain-containing protein n=1 Tax=Entamoeba nuttalli TaxID=412467 RepID=A0ABQ0D9R1_9EUKA
MTSNQNERKFPEEGQKGVKENENKEENVIQFIYNKFNELKGQYEIIPKVKDERKTKELDDNGIKVKQRNKTLETFKIIKQLEEWIEKRINDILFDSDIDGWNITTSVFDQRLMNKENLIILIKDTEDNLFGGYVHSKIDKIDEWINDPNSFLFSLKIKGRIKGMKKFDIEDSEYAIYIFKRTDDSLFSFGYSGIFGCLSDIFVYKENNKTNSYCYQETFEYKGIENALCGKQHPHCFIPKQIVVVEMK